MTFTHQMNENGDILMTENGDIQGECCCESGPQDCPTNCDSGCDSPKTMVISGFTGGTCAFGSLPCTNFNGTYTITRNSGTCVWQGQNENLVTLGLTCTGTKWIVSSPIGDCGSLFERDNTGSCPETGSYTFTPGSTPCTGTPLCTIS